jgi:hypothetical protein
MEGASVQANDEPDIKLVGLSIWFDGYQFPDSADYWDANWIVVRVRAEGQNAVVKLHDPCVHLPELAGWLDACMKLDAGEVDEARLPTMEPYLQVKIDRTGEFGRLLATVAITPDNISQFHEFRYPIDPSYVRLLIDSLRRVLVRYPVRGSRD